jgi:hypothetical protein
MWMPWYRYFFSSRHFFDFFKTSYFNRNEFIIRYLSYFLCYSMWCWFCISFRHLLWISFVLPESGHIYIGWSQSSWSALYVFRETRFHASLYTSALHWTPKPDRVGVIKVDFSGVGVGVIKENFSGVKVEVILVWKIWFSPHMITVLFFKF